MTDYTKNIVQLLNHAKHILVAGHASPDGDCAGAMLAIGFALQQLGKPRVLVIPDPIPGFLRFLPGSDEFRVTPAELSDVDLVIVPDCSDLRRLGSYYDQQAILFNTLPVINIDHHISNERFGKVNVVDPKAAAVCEQLYYLLPGLGITIDLAIATCLLTGIVTDTQSFRTPSTTPRTMRAATELMERGAPLTLIADHIFNSRTLPTLRLWALALSRLEVVDGIIWTDLNEEMLHEAGASWDESEALTNLISSVQTAQVSLLFKQMPEGVVRVSLRSRGRVDVAAVAAAFGGGGHVGAAGCTLAVPLEQAKRLLIPRIQESIAAFAR